MSRAGRAIPLLAAAALLGLPGCVDLNVSNPNAPDVERMNLDALLRSGFFSWVSTKNVWVYQAAVSVMTFQHSTWAFNEGQITQSEIPRQPLKNSEGNEYWSGPLKTAWYQRYAAIATVRDVLRKLDVSLDGSGEGGYVRERAYVKFVQGLAHGSLALEFDSAYVYDETMETGEPVLQEYGAVMDAALGYLEAAATLAESDTFTVPAAWMSQPVTSAELARLAYSWRARFRASVARTPTERAVVDWDAVEADVGRGITDDWAIVCDSWFYDAGVAWADEMIFYGNFRNWSQLSYWVLGMADTSGAYQAWLATPTGDKVEFLMVTPDTRFPQGTDEAAQQANPGAYYEFSIDAHRRADRGRWRWSNYHDHRWDWWINGDGTGDLPLVTVREMRLLEAEAAYWTGDYATVASIVNETRALYGLNETDAQGTNTSCVPKLPDGSCGDLWEMLKWEKRLETQFVGPDRVGWWFDGRGWGDLMVGTFLQWPVPYHELDLLEQPRYDVGGLGGLYAAPVGSYGY